MSELRRKASAAKVNESPGSKTTAPASSRAGGHASKPSESSDLQEIRKKTDTLAKAYEVIRKRDLIPPEPKPSLDSLSQGLLFCAELSNQAVVKELLCAFATYANSIRENLIADSIADKLRPTLDGIEAARLKLDELSEVQEKIGTDLTGAVGLLASEVSKLHHDRELFAGNVEKMGHLRDEVAEDLRKAQNTTGAGVMGAGMLEVPLHGQSGPHPANRVHMVGVGGRPTYAAVIQHQLPISHATTLARQDAKARQILVDIKSRLNANGEPLTEQELVEKANLTLDLMTKDPATFPEGARFLSVRKLRHGGLLYEMSSPTAASWLQKKNNMDAFARSFGSEAVVRARHYAVVWPNVPVSFIPSEQAYRQIERENGWSERDLLLVHWIKPVERRKPNQQTAYVIAKFSSAGRANDVILNGLTFRGRKINAWRLAKEARRCMRCQKLEPGHLAADCKDTPACGTCASPEHTTQLCHEPEGQGRRCVNCSESGHASWDRACPSFITANRKLQRANSLEQYRFFPDPNNPLTWEVLEHNSEPPAPLQTYPVQSVGHARPLPVSEWPRQGPMSFNDMERALRDLDRRDQQSQSHGPAPHARNEPDDHVRGRALGRGANAVPIATHRVRPQTLNFRDSSGRRQSTLTREGGFSLSRPATRPSSRVSNDSNRQQAHYE